MEKWGRFLMFLTCARGYFDGSTVLIISSEALSSIDASYRKHLSNSNGIIFAKDSP